MTEEKKIETLINPVVLNNVVIGLDSVPTYDGLSNVDEFIGIIEETATLANWTEAQKVAITRLKLREDAKQFVKSEEDLKTTPSWDALSRALKKQFQRTEINGESRRKFLECKQRTVETSRQFLTRLKSLGNHTMSYTGIKDVDAVLKHRFEEDLITQFMMGLLMPIKARILSKAPNTLNSALELAEREEAIESLIKPSTPHREYIRGMQSSEPERNKSNDVIRCYKCQQAGHFARDCRDQKPREFKCFKCNKVGHFANDCRTTNARDLRTCYNCYKVGHLRRNCPTSQRTGTEGQRSLNSQAATFRPRSQAAQQTGNRH